MRTLHTINQAPSNSQLWSSCLAALLPEDTLLLIENGVLGGTQAHRFAAVPNSVLIYALTPDLQTRGIAGQLAPNVIAVSDETFVQLACEHQKVVSWF
ncbi:sulfurtransferase complex subunit TusB [Neptunomonas concharum]|uniref:Sulfurtransferase complex subunit TusB n=1 Tax=Neptunomonas concharum TaxID=1031538 RepID=A0A5P1RBJ7_9GAMM|nr:sulfurtransferase complex subunit TusB [Neptunomonas concharum]QEQ97034.1 sulfurtransferase complex subunit TusB [Neptunomonas concharum]